MLNRNAGLDILRASAIILVLNCHIASTLGASGPWRAFGWGGRGVDLFFVLSGWLLGYQLCRELCDTGTLDFKRFWLRRWLRTLPAYYVILLLPTFGWQLFRFGPEVLDARFLIFTQNYLPEMPYFGISWSLCVEEHFYLAIAPILLLVYRFPWTRWLLIPLLLLPTACRAMNWYTTSTQTHVRYDQCAVGVILAAVAVYAPTLWKRLCRLAPYLATIATAALCLPILARSVKGFPDIEYGRLVYGEALYAVLFGALVLLMNSRTFFSESLRSAPIHYLANRAYALYLVHIEALSLVSRLDVPSPVFCIGVWGISLVMAEILHRCIEQPFMNLRERIPAARHRT